MNCNDAGTLVARYADDELDSVQGRSVEQHLRSCTACAAKHERVLALRAQIRTEAPRFTATPVLRERVRALLANAKDIAPTPPRPERNRWRWLTEGALAGCAATVLAWVIGTAVIDWRANEDVAN
jgi:anti-sigma factor RsiW